MYACSVSWPIAVTHTPDWLWCVVISKNISRLLLLSSKLTLSGIASARTISETPRASKTPNRLTSGSIQVPYLYTSQAGTPSCLLSVVIHRHPTHASSIGLYLAMTSANRKCANAGHKRALVQSQLSHELVRRCCPTIAAFWIQPASTVISRRKQSRVCAQQQTANYICLLAP